MPSWRSSCEKNARNAFSLARNPCPAGLLRSVELKGSRLPRRRAAFLQVSLSALKIYGARVGLPLEKTERPPGAEKIIEARRLLPPVLHCGGLLYRNPVQCSGFFAMKA
jgi:hypothetical protein